MPDKVTVSYRPRYYECDPLGQLHVANYVGWVIQAALEAGAPGDVGQPGLAAHDWLARVGEIGLQIAHPILFGETVDVQTWVSRQGPPVWRREFRLQRAGSDVAAALAFVDAFEDIEESENDGDDDEFDTLEPEPARSSPPAWDDPVPDPPQPPSHAFHASWVAGWPNMDISGQLEPGRLTQLAGDMEGRAAAIAHWGADRDLEYGITWQVLEHRLEMFVAVEPGDQLSVVSFIGDVGDEDMVRHTLIVRPENGRANEVARMRTRWQCLESASGQPCTIPDDWILQLEDQMSGE